MTPLAVAAGGERVKRGLFRPAPLPGRIVAKPAPGAHHVPN